MTLRMYLAGAGLLALVGGGLWVYAQGREAAQDEIEKENIDAAENAIDAAGDWRACLDAGGVWDFAAADCARPESRGGE